MAHGRREVGLFRAFAVRGRMESDDGLHEDRPPPFGGTVTEAPELDGLGKVLSSERLLVVPRYQRRYEWRPRNAEELWGDTVARLNALHDWERDGSPPHVPPERHFLGSIVVTKVEGTGFFALPQWSLVDGQQRLMTFSLLLAVIRDRFTQLLDPSWWSLTQRYLAVIDDSTGVKAIQEIRIRAHEKDIVEFEKIL